jgi:RHS repeat-associated protein
VTRHGFTWQTALGTMGLNDMNGRIQDVMTGRFLSADPTVPYPDSTQSFNRYSYVQNNPLTYVDPTGFEDTVTITGSRSGGLDGGYGGGRALAAQPAGISPAAIDFESEQLEEVTVTATKKSSDQDAAQSGMAVVVITAQRTKSLGGVQIDFKLQDLHEQMWVVDANCDVIYVPTVAQKLGCDDGTTAGQDRPVDPNFTLDGDQALIHSHPNWALPFPGPKDGVIPSRYHIPNFGISPSGTWVVNPGPPLSVTLLSGTWGTGPNGERFNSAAYTHAINAPKSGGKAVSCHAIK